MRLLLGDGLGREGTTVDICCSVCGRRGQEGEFLRFRSVNLCTVCERMSLFLMPGHPLYRFWISLLRAALCGSHR